MRLVEHPEIERRPAGVTSLRLLLLDRRVAVESNNPSYLREFAHCFDALASESNPWATPEHLRVSAESDDGSSSRVTTEPSDALAEYGLGSRFTPSDLAGAVNQWAVSSTPRHYVFHAGAVARNGRAILLPAASHCGKTTLTAGLVQQGFELLSDEVGALEIDSRCLVSYPRALWIRKDALPVLGLERSAGIGIRSDGSRAVSAAELGGTRAPDSARPAVIVVPRYERNAKTTMKKLRLGEAIIALMESSCSQKRFKAKGLDLVIALARQLPTYRLHFSRLEDALHLLERVFIDACSEVPSQ